MLASSILEDGLVAGDKANRCNKRSVVREQMIWSGRVVLWLSAIAYMR